MFTNRLFSLIRKEFIQIVRDPRTLIITFLMPLVMLLLLGYAATNDVKNVAIVVIDRDQTAASRALVNAYRAADYFKVQYEVDSETEMLSLIDDNSASAGLIIPPGYGEKIASGQTAEVAFIIDGSNPTTASVVQSAAVLIGQSVSTQLSLTQLNAHGQGSSPQAALDVRTQVLYNPGLVSSYYMIPALIGLILQFLTTMLTSTAIVRERERGTIEQLIVTPLRSWELVVGKLIPYVLIAFLDTIEILVFGSLVFNVPINGSVALLLLLTALFLITTLGIGLLVSTLANTQQEAMLTTLFTILPSVFLSGFLFPLEAIPQVLQWVTYLVPLRYFLIISRGIILKGVGIGSLWPQVIALSIFAFSVMGLAALRFHKSLD
ncbi:MAG: ABC transporter permease [Anaerolineaceae bacterium]|jgi:ABC-2 type transport system permease protein